MYINPNCCRNYTSARVTISLDEQSFYFHQLSAQCGHSLQKDFQLTKDFPSSSSFATASDGSFTIGTYYKNPKTFITQVGLYNDANELLAVAKLSKPLLKSFSREALIKVKLDF